MYINIYMSFRGICLSVFRNMMEKKTNLLRKINSSICTFMRALAHVPNTGNAMTLKCTATDCNKDAAPQLCNMKLPSFPPSALFILLLRLAISTVWAVLSCIIRTSCFPFQDVVLMAMLPVSQTMCMVSYIRTLVSDELEVVAYFEVLSLRFSADA
jgi:hypothetical protein